jgi:single-stranded-DNA-specific exonuclease
MTSEPAGAAFGVTRSAAGQLWRLREASDRDVLALTQRLGVSEMLARLLATRNVPIDQAEAYLEPRLRDLLPDPSTLKDMDKAASRLADAIEQGEAVAVFGDYDVDGATSSAVLARYWKMLGQQPHVYIPDRQKEGYGPNKAAFESLDAQGYKLIVTVDCGTMAHEVLADAEARGMQVIVADHHQSGGGLPSCFALINPRRADDTSGLGHLAAVGVSFLLVVGLNRELRQRGYFDTRDEPKLASLLDLVSLGTVCDVVPLQGVNRAFVRQGAQVIAAGGNRGMAALAHSASSTPPFGTYELGFQMGPRVNAGGRVGQADLGVRLLSSDDPEEAAGLAARLNDFNTERRAIEAQVLAEAHVLTEEKIAAHNAPPPFLLLARRDWHPGVIGIVAGRLKDKFHRPSFVIAIDENGVGKGSARSVSAVDIGRLVAAAVDKKLIEAGGGHAMAAGVTLHESQIAGFEAFLAEELGSMSLDGPRELYVEASLTPRAANRALYEELQKAGPFGAGNPEPRLVLPAARVIKPSIVGDSHVRCILGGEGGGRLKAMAFSSVPEEVRQLILTAQEPLHIAGFLRADDWNGRRDVQFMVHDAAVARSA